MKKEEQAKLKRMAHIVKNFVKIGYVVCIVGMIAAVVGAVVIGFIPGERLTGPDKLNLSLDSIVSYSIDMTGKEAVSVKPIILSFAVMAAVMLAGLILLIRQLIHILETVEKDQPFAPENSERIRVMGLILLIGSVVYRTAAAFVALTIVQTFSLQNAAVNFGVDPTLVIVGFLLLILAGVFKYGSFLQQEYDSTL